MADETHTLARREAAPIALDGETYGRLVDGFATTGDISRLSSRDRARYYVQRCLHLGLDPLSHPLVPLKVNGKEILYPHRGATDQLAKIHKINREIVEGPEVREVAGVPMAWAKCRAMHPDGRVDTATATVPLDDPANALMKCETKAKRRATLSILGLGMLDETEVETIAPRHRAPAAAFERHLVEEETRDAALVVRMGAAAADPDPAHGRDTLAAIRGEVAALGLAADSPRRARLLEAYTAADRAIAQRAQDVADRASADAASKAAEESGS